MDTYIVIIKGIVTQQAAIVGPLALELARKVDGLSFDNTIEDITITKEPIDVLDDLIQTYAQFFGQASIEVCKDAVRELKPPIPPEKLPSILQ